MKKDVEKMEQCLLDFPQLVSDVHQNWLVLLHFFAQAGDMLNSSARLAQAIPSYVPNDRIDMDLVTLLQNLRTDLIKLKTDLAVCASANERLAKDFNDLRAAFEMLHTMNQISYQGFGHA